MHMVFFSRMIGLVWRRLILGRCGQYACMMYDVLVVLRSWQGVSEFEFVNWCACFGARGSLWFVGCFLFTSFSWVLGIVCGCSDWGCYSSGGGMLVLLGVCQCAMRLYLLLWSGSRFDRGLARFCGWCVPVVVVGDGLCWGMCFVVDGW